MMQDKAGSQTGPATRMTAAATTGRLTGLVPAALAALVLAAVATPAAAQPSTYAIDPTHTFVYFEARHQGLSTARGRFDRKSGSVTIDRAARSGRAEIVIETGSINTGVVPFDGALRGAGYFDAAQFPTATFVGDRFVFDGDRLTEVQGNLTLIGQTRPVTLRNEYWACTINTRLNREVCGGDFVTRIKRSDWGMRQSIPTVPDDIGLIIQVEGIKQE